VNIIDEQTRPSLARGVRVQLDPRTQEPMLLFPEGAIYLSETAHAIVTRCAGKLTAQAIIDSLASEYETGGEALRQDVFDCLKELHQRKLLVIER
jgi:pyrroloquinoline quinone biosynthesis protein D